MTILRPCAYCATRGLPDGVAPHSTGQHLVMWATAGHGGEPAWQLILSEAPPPGCFNDVDVRNIDNVTAVLPPSCRVIWRTAPRPA